MALGFITALSGSQTIPRLCRRSLNVVSGLSISGTSMVMKMFATGGENVLTDNIRKADYDNLKRYFEYEKVQSS